MLNESRLQSVIFDLDGTLIDSAPGILACFDRVLRDVGISTHLPLDSRLIGPPLRQTLKMLTGFDTEADLGGLVERFKYVYDTEGYRVIRIYPGVEDMLAAFHSRKIPMAIATNKRRLPTLKIVEYLGWDTYFQTVGTLDMCSPPYPDKAALLEGLLTTIGLDGKASLYVGDKLEDGEAALVNGMLFIAAGWGYGEWDAANLPSGWTLLSTSSELTRMVDFDAFPNFFVEPIASGIKSI